MKYLAGPWIGEFGWELFCWQGWLRAQAKGAKKFVVASRPGMEYLYEDFCTEFIAVPAPEESSNERCDGFHPPDLRENYPNFTYLDPSKRRAKLKPVHIPVLEDQEFIKFGEKREESEFDVVFHARSTTKGGTKIRNWPERSWEKLRDALGDYKIASIGSMSGSNHVIGTEDLRGLDLKQVCTVLRNAKLAIGPSSGPMHLASLCGTDQLVWSEPRNRVRYVRYWNPFETKVHYLEYWTPNVAEVLGECPLYDGPEKDPGTLKRMRKKRKDKAWRKYGNQIIAQNPNLARKTRARRKGRR